MYEKLDRTVGVPYGCANEKTLAVMYVLFGEVMFNVLPSYFEKIIKTRRNKVYTKKNHPLLDPLELCRVRVQRMWHKTVATMFWRVGTMPSTAVMCCCKRVSGTCDEGEEGPVVAFGATVTGVGVGAVEGRLGTAIGAAACFC